MPKQRNMGFDVIPPPPLYPPPDHQHSPSSILPTRANSRSLFPDQPMDNLDEDIPRPQLPFSPSDGLPIPDIDDGMSRGSIPLQVPTSVGSSSRPVSPPLPIARSEWKESLSTIIRPTPRYASLEHASPRASPLAWRRAISTPRPLDDASSHTRALLTAAGDAGSPDGLMRTFRDTPSNNQSRFGAVTTPGWVPISNRAAHSTRPPITITKQRAENQDCYCIYAPFPESSEASPTTSPTADDVLLAVFDGHGDAGRRIAHFSRAFLIDELSEASQGLYRALMSGVSQGGAVSLATAIHRRRWKMFTDAFEATERALRSPSSRIGYRDSGTAAMVALLSGKDLYVAWVGHSRCVIGRTWTAVERYVTYEAVELSRDHTANSAVEMKRIRSELRRGPKKQRPSQMQDLLQRKAVERNENLLMTRTLGDTIPNTFGTSAKPEITYTHLRKEDAFLIVGSNGVWSVLTCQEAVDIVGRKRSDGSSAEAAAAEIVREAKRRWRRKSCRAEDITVLVMWITENTGTAGVNHASSSRERSLKSRLKRASRIFSFRKSSENRPEVFSVHSDGSLKQFVPTVL